MTNCLHPIGTGLNLITGEQYDMPCKRWRCPVCGAILKNKLLDRVAQFFQGEPELYFMTLTERQGAGRNIMKDAKRLHDSIKKKHPGLKAFWVKEFTKKGERHLHLIINVSYEKKDLSARWRRSTKGESYIVDISEARAVRNPAGYMMKYMSKQLHSEHEHMLDGTAQFKGGERRYGFWAPKGLRAPPMDTKRPPASERQIIPSEASPGGVAEGQYDLERSEPGSVPGDIEIILDDHWNPASKYWMSWHERNARAWGPAYERHMEYMTLSPLGKFRVYNDGRHTGLNQEYDHRPPEVEKPVPYPLTLATLIKRGYKV